MLLVLVKFSLDSLLDLPHSVRIQVFQIIDIDLINLRIDGPLGRSQQWLENFRDNIPSHFRITIQNDSSPTDIQSVIHL